MQRMEWNIPVRGYGMFCLCTGLAIALASISWYALERPVNGLKRHFQNADAHPGMAPREAMPTPAQAA
jgi:peptidoglycan/LPS O-acetylase OafA/YrhL